MKFKDWLSVGASLVIAIAFVCVAFFLPVPKAQPPQTVDVFGTQYRVEILSEIPGHPDWYGYTDCKLHVVHMRTNSGDPRTTLFHELTHAQICYTDRFGSGLDNLQYNSTDNAAHEGIYTFTYGWREMFRRNPGLAEYIGGRD